MVRIYARITILPAISLQGPLHTVIMDGGFDTQMFQAFIRGLVLCMNPYPGPNSVLVIDNCSTHHVVNVREIVEAR